MKKTTISILGIHRAFFRIYVVLRDTYILVVPEAITIITGLDYPKYIIPFLGVLKLWV